MQQWLEKIFITKTNNIFIQLFRYGFVGGVAFLVDFGAMVLLTETMGLPYIWSATISFVLGLVTNYLLSISWVFDNHKVSNRWTEFLVFSVIGIIGLGLNDLFLYLFTDKVGLHYTLSKIAATVIVFFWNFFARRASLFRSF